MFLMGSIAIYGVFARRWGIVGGTPSGSLCANSLLEHLIIIIMELANLLANHRLFTAIESEMADRQSFCSQAPGPSSGIRTSRGIKRSHYDDDG